MAAVRAWGRWADRIRADMSPARARPRPGTRTRPGRRARAEVRVVLLIGIAVPCAAEGQVVTGWVFEAGTRSGIPAADVALLDSTAAVLATALTAEDGRFVLVAPAPGNYGLLAARLGYEDGPVETVEVGEEETVVVELVLATEAVALAPLRVVARDRSLRQRLFREYYQRMERLEHEHGRTMFPRTELVRYDGWAYDRFMQQVAPRLERVRCQPVVYWDGWRRTPDAPMPISSIEGIEFHPGMGPIDTPFVNSGGCGVILVWTRPYDESERSTAARAWMAAGVAGVMFMLGFLLSP